MVAATPAQSEMLLTGRVLTPPTDARRPSGVKHPLHPPVFISSGIRFQESITATTPGAVTPSCRIDLQFCRPLCLLKIETDKVCNQH